MGRVSPSAVKFDPVREVLALVLGIRIQKQILKNLLNIKIVC
jgi:hypothetical protein